MPTPVVKIIKRIPTNYYGTNYSPRPFCEGVKYPENEYGLPVLTDINSYKLLHFIDMVILSTL